MHYGFDENNKPVKLLDVSEVEVWLKSKKRLLKRDAVQDYQVSTVFLVMDHSLNILEMHSDPILWETMIFGYDDDNYQERYTSYEAAMAGHQRAIDFLLGKVR